MQTECSILSQPLSIGRVTLPNRVALAPMSGITDLPFRRLAHRFGAGMIVTEMIASRELVCDADESHRRMRRDAGFVHIVQLAGCEAHWMAEGARIAEAAGADIIDINMGCPAKKVTGGYSGSALMRDSDHALRLVRATVEAVEVPVTLKMRLGWDEHSLNAASIAALAQDAGVRLVTVHGRTRCQFYKGRADWDAIAQVKQAVTIPLIANGDVATRADCVEIMRRSGADAVMVGRAAQGQPWLPGVLAGNSRSPRGSSEIAAIVDEHYRMMIEHYGTDIGVRQARKHVGWYLERYTSDLPGALKKTLMTSADQHEVRRLLGEAFTRFAREDAPSGAQMAA